MTTPIGFGTGPYGQMPWGSSVPDAPVIEPLSPSFDEIGASTDGRIVVQVRDRTGVDPGAFFLKVDGTVYVRDGAAEGGASVRFTNNDLNGFDAEVTLPFDFEKGDRPEVFASVTNLFGEEGERLYFFEVGYKLRILSIENPFEGTLLVHFSDPVLTNDDFYRVQNWKISPVSVGAAPLTITSVTSNEAKPQTVVLRYAGGGSTYQLEVFNVQGLLGSPFELNGNVALFEILFGSQPDYEITLFDSIYGALGIAQRELTRRSMDDLTADRALALAMDEQFRLRQQILTNTEGRTGKPGKLRTP